MVNAGELPKKVSTGYMSADEFISRMQYLYAGVWVYVSFIYIYI